MRDGIFISYRRSDSQAAAGRLFDQLSQAWPRERLFMDVDGIRPGESFGDVIARRLQATKVMLVVIGPAWVDARDDQGARRLDAAEDWVRMEVAAALADPGVVVVPVLVDGARVPDADELPALLRPLVGRNAWEVRSDRFAADVLPLVEHLVTVAPPRRWWRGPAGVGLGLAVAVVAVAAWALTRPTCGDGVVDAAAGEACDDGNTLVHDGCSARCQVERCGDGVVQLGEACDDGNLIGRDGCSAACQPDACGDGVVQEGEGCDDGNHASDDGCGPTCARERCGDRVVQAGEGCDDGNLTSSDGCSSTCQPERCGDGVVQVGEGCDGGPSGGTSTGCGPDCRFLPFTPVTRACEVFVVAGAYADIVACPPHAPIVAGMLGGMGHSSASDDPHRIKCCALELRDRSSLVVGQACVEGPKVGQADDWAPGGDFVVTGVSGGEGHKSGNDQRHLVRYCPLPRGVRVTEDCHKLRMEADNFTMESCPDGSALVSVGTFDVHTDATNWHHEARCCALVQE